jgi:hypothetical protein
MLWNRMRHMRAVPLGREQVEDVRYRHRICIRQRAFGGNVMQRAVVGTEPEVGSVVYLDPRGHVYSVDRRMSSRLGQITGTVAALLDNGNDTSRFFFEGLAAVLKDHYGVNQVILTTKFTSTKPAGPDIIQHLAAEADFLVAGVAL